MYKLTDIEEGSELTVSIKYHGTLIIINDGVYIKSKNRPITKIDYLLGDNYFYPITKVFDIMPSKSYYGRFTCCANGTIYQDFGCYDSPDIINNLDRPVIMKSEFVDAVTAGFSAVCEYLNVRQDDISKIILRYDEFEHHIDSGVSMHRTQDTFGHMITLDMLNNISGGTIINLLPQANYDDLLIKVATELFLEYIGNTKHIVTDVLVGLPDFLKNGYIQEKLAIIDDYRLSDVVDNNTGYYDVFCFMVSLLRRKILNRNKFIKPLHIRKFAGIMNRIDDLYVPYVV